MSGLPGAPRVLHIFGSFTPDDPQAARAARLANAFGGRMRHSLVSGTGEAGGLALFEKGVPVERVAGFPSLSGVPSPGRMQKIARAMVDYHLVATYGRGALDAALAHTMFSELLSLPPLIHHEDGSDETAKGRDGLRSKWARRIGLGKAAGLVVPTEVMEGEALVAWQQPLGRVKLIRDGVDLARFGKTPRRDALPRLTKRAGERWIACVAGPGESAGLAAVIASLPHIAEAWHLVAAAPSADLAAVRSQASGLGVEHRLHVLPDRAHGAALTMLSDLWVVAGGREPLPLHAIEAMAAEKPVVGFETGELAASLAEDNASDIVPPGNAAALAEAIERLAGDDFLRRRIGAANREKAVAERDGAAMIAAYRRLYASAMKRDTV